MSDTAIFVGQLHYNYNYMLRNIDGLTPEESLLQPPFSGNCLNWLLGHILVFRNFMLRYIEQPEIMTKEEIAIYNINSAPITGPDSPHLPWDRLVADLETSQTRLINTLPSLPPDYLQGLINPEKPVRGTKYEAYVTNCVHEAMHTGQLEQMREVILAHRQRQ